MTDQSIHDGPPLRDYAAMGRKGGASRSPRKQAASRLNGFKGGWPKGRPRKPPPTDQSKHDEVQT